MSAEREELERLRLEFSTQPVLSTRQELEQLRSEFAPAQQQIPAFPEERGETRAAQELPELGSGGLLSNVDAPTKLKLSALIATTTDNEELADIITENVPNIGKSFSPGGEIMLFNNDTGARVIVNKPGLSKLDVIQAIGLGAAFTPAGRGALLGTAGLTGAKVLGQRALQGGVLSGLTQAGLEETQEQAGGEFDPSEIALSATLGGASEFAAPVIGAITRRAKAVTQPLRDAAGDVLTDALERGKVLTSDIFPPDTFIGKAFQKVGERIPFVGTAKIRAAQQQSRNEAITEFLIENDVNLDSNFAVDIVESASKTFKQAQAKGARLRNEAVDALDPLGNVSNPSTLRQIETEISSIERLGGQGDQELLGIITSFKDDLRGSFALQKDFRTSLFKKISNFKSGLPGSGGADTDRVLKRIAGALSEDLDNFAIAAKNERGATKEVRLAANKWKASNRIFSESFDKVKRTQLKKVLEKGDVTPEVVDTILRGGKQSELQLLNRNIGLSGKKSTRQRLLQKAADISTKNGEINPTLFLNALDRPNVRAATKVFFKGADGKSLDGMKKFLNITRRAQEEAASIATQQEATLIGGGALIASAPATAAFIIPAGLGTRAFESTPIRNLLIRLSSVKPNTPAQRRIIDEIQTLITSASVTAGQIQGN